MRVSKQLPQVQKQVDLLESAGFEVHLKHDSKCKFESEPVVGATFVYIDDAHGYPVGIGNAKCSKKDNFNRVTGTKIAFRRAIADFYDTVGHKKASAVLYPKRDAS